MERIKTGTSVDEVKKEINNGHHKRVTGRKLKKILLISVRKDKNGGKASGKNR